MKPFLEVDRTYDDNNRFPNGVEFNTIDVSKETYDEYMSLIKERELFEKKLHTPYYLQHLPVFCLLLSLCACMFIVPYFFNPSEINTNNAFRILVTFILFISGLAGYFILKKILTDKQKSFFDSKEYKEIKDKWENHFVKVRKELQIPDNCITADILFFHYKVTDGQITPISNSKKKTPFENPAYLFYVEDNVFYVASAFDKFAINLDAFTEITKVNEYIKIPFWNKPDSFQTEKYKSYYISVEGKELLIDSYYILHFTHKDEDWGLYFPCYELPVFEELTGLRAKAH